MDKGFQISWTDDDSGEKIVETYFTKNGRCFRHSTLTGRTKRISEEDMMIAEDEYRNA